MAEVTKRAAKSEQGAGASSAPLWKTGGRPQQARFPRIGGLKRSRRECAACEGRESVLNMRGTSVSVSRWVSWRVRRRGSVVVARGSRCELAVLLQDEPEWEAQLEIARVGFGGAAVRVERT